MSSTDGQTASNPYAGERLIVEYIGDAPADANNLASRLPWFLGGPIFFVAYLLRGLNIFGMTFYAVTNRRILVRRGITRKEVLSIPLEAIERIEVVDENTFSRTGDLELLGSGDPLPYRLRGIQDPWPARQTVLDAVVARKEILKVLARQKRLAEAAAK